MAKPVRSSKTIVSICVLLLVCGAVGIRAGGALETIDITAQTPSPIPGQILARVIGIKWDTRAVPVKYSINNTLNPIPNPLGPASLSLDAAQAELQASFNAWNDIKTSFIDMRVTGTTSNPGPRGFDFINELTFRTSDTFAAIASSPSVTLIADTTLVDGDLIDNDADSDVSDKISVVTDFDGDGDLEFPAGFYKAGTILDNDVQFNTKVSNGFRYTIDPAAADIVTRSIDLAAVAVHEFGHSHGLSHSINNQNSAIDGNGATMFPFIDTGDPFSELSMRTVDIDDVAYSSYFYPEGTAHSGLPALQSGDLAFTKVFGLITGELWHRVLDQPIAGGNVFTVDEHTGSIGVAAFSGTTQLSFDPATDVLFIVDESIIDGKYVIPVPKGKYGLGIEPIDGTPVPTASISFTAQIGELFGQQNFNEEPAVRNDRHGDDGGDKVSVNVGQTRRNIDIITSADINIDNFGSRDFAGFTLAPAGRLYAVRVPASQVTDAAGDRKLRLKAMAFHTGTVDASVTPTFVEALLTTGTVNADGSLASIHLDRPLARVRTVVGQDDDLAPVFIKHGALLGQVIQWGVRFGVIENLFLVLQVPTTQPFPGVSGRAPLIGLDGGVAVNDVPILGLSYISDDGGATFTRRTDFNFRFSLRFADLFLDNDDSGDGDDE